MNRREFTRMLAAAGAAVAARQAVSGPSLSHQGNASPIHRRSVEDTPVILEVTNNRNLALRDV